MRITRTRASVASLTALLVLTSGGLAACDENDEPVDEVVSEEQTQDPVEVTDDEIYGDLDTFEDEQITVRGIVTEVVTDNLLRIEAEEGSGDELVVAFVPDGAVPEPGTEVQVTGVVREWDRAAIGDELGINIANVDISEEFAVVASSADPVSGS